MKTSFRRLIPWSLGTVAAVLVGSVAVAMLSKNQGVDPGKFETVRVTRRDIASRVLATGIVRAMVGAEVRVGSRVSGVVKKVHVDIGDWVEKGQLLAELEPAEFEAGHNQALANRQIAATNLTYAEKDWNRAVSLFKSSLISREQMNLAQRAFEVARSQLDLDEANVAFSEIQLGYTKTFASISGVVASVSTNEGETVAASFAAPTFVTIIDLNRLEVWAYVDETDIGRIEIGQRAVFTVDTYPATDFEGRVTAIYPRAEIQDNVVNYIAIVTIADRRGKILRPEMTTTVRIYLQTHDNVLTVPNNAIRRETGRRFVYVAGEGQPRKQWVKIGWKDDLYSEIIEGLEEAEGIIIGDVELKSD